MPTTPPADHTDPEWFTGDQLAARYNTTLRTVLRWVKEQRIPAPTKFGKLSRWAREVVHRLDHEGVNRPLAHGDELSRLPPLGLVVRCPCCESEIRVKRDGSTEPVTPATEKKAPKAKGRTKK
ncbi:hypothetical protein J8F10_18040 [Gemmata sp. G18]|uniref:Helix-turn-helix domain-containing protein n=1 Tax=Gemmata palustris TaxID=2822762 RepID=A0ABS5BTW5_9BACT|nr:hypothetical protein [Gemmata palustris]MBP3957167.1 hypothetical protein [Gemmata palustris]